MNLRIILIKVFVTKKCLKAVKFYFDRQSVTINFGVMSVDSL